MKFYKYGFWIVLLLLVVLLVLNLLKIWPPRDEIKVWDLAEVSYDLIEYHFIEKSMEGEITNSTGNVVTVWRHRVECPREIELQNFNVLEEEVEETEVE